MISLVSNLKQFWFLVNALLLVGCEVANGMQVIKTYVEGVACIKK